MAGYIENSNVDRCSPFPWNAWNGKRRKKSQKIILLIIFFFIKAVYLAEYESLNKTGELTVAAYYTAELLSCAKRSLARILVLIASMGFGIVKYAIRVTANNLNSKLTRFCEHRPRLGAMLQRIVGVGIIYMILSAVETYLILVQPKNEGSHSIDVASFLLALLDAAICFWIFLSLVQTTRTLRLRR